jgi:hypothetical protein
MSAALPSFRLSCIMRLSEKPNSPFQTASYGFGWEPHMKEPSTDNNQVYFAIAGVSALLLTSSFWLTIVNSAPAP